ncbi:hypothetical protein QJS10_CPB04g01010 [Acorus calamus]|uniref:Uncharacterized protein n=1 Tax=Acorus calamus TaxID=4465 RepID=A0AAV9F470_ACOCL|nr:hypothetical protein QJS10_CPB04g01010 [Acorus calamus]
MKTEPIPQRCETFFHTSLGPLGERSWDNQEMHQQRHKHITKQGHRGTRDTTVHSPDSEHMRVWMRSLGYPPPLWVVCLSKDSEPKDLQEGLL